VNIAGVEIGPGQPCRTIAEISNNHNGSLDRALRLIEAAEEAGADFVKFQAYTPDELVALRGDGPAPSQWGEQGWTMRDLYTKAQTPHKWFPALVDTARQVGIPWFSSVFGLDSLAMLEGLGCPAYKIASLDRDARWLLGAVWETGKPTLFSSPSPLYTPGWLNIFCPPGYPQTRFGFTNPLGYDGFSYHGVDPQVPMIAVALGAHVIEAHFQLDAEPSELEANISLGQTQWATMVSEIRKVEAML
jgi:sialic acid synthase SpsE